MSYGVDTVIVHKKLKLDKRRGSENWYVRLTLDNGKRIVKSTKTDNLDEATERAWELLYETQARIKNNLPAQTRKFKHVAEYAIKRMREELNKGGGKQAYKDYISALRRWLMPYFEATDIAKIDLAALTAFDTWRTKTNKKPFSQSGINNHNAAINRVFDEAELHGWLVKSLRAYSGSTKVQKAKAEAALRTKNIGAFSLRSARGTKRQTARKQQPRAKCCATMYCFWQTLVSGTAQRHLGCAGEASNGT